MSADWCLALGHPDFAAEWRDLTDPLACEAAPRAAGGLVVLWDAAIGTALPLVGEVGGAAQVRVSELEPGDIAVIAALGLEAGAIWTGKRWALRAARGLHFVQDTVHVKILKAWRP